jgi:hypothetical protein
MFAAGDDEFADTDDAYCFRARGDPPPVRPRSGRARPPACPPDARPTDACPPLQPKPEFTLATRVPHLAAALEDVEHDGVRRSGYYPAREAADGDAPAAATARGGRRRSDERALGAVLAERYLGVPDLVRSPPGARRQQTRTDAGGGARCGT